MPSHLVTIRDAVRTVIEAERVSGSTSFPYTNFTTEVSHIPRNDYENLKDGKLFVIGNLNDDGEVQSRGPSSLCLRDILIQVAFQRSNIVLPAGNATLDLMIELEEKIRDIVRKMNSGATLATANTTLGFTQGGYRCRRIEALKDNDGVPYHYYMAREANCFESYFTAIFQATLS